ncbi:hypothetical protein [Haloimpatiens massiliensis]|uniref:hypothetical protein n=1 Tax=Haloimpatiens massiliensis TaxID=1658110 RepID=UPI000C84ADFF|nr:hypothetical protein [Haloimpatiens massiliensis]
MIKIELDFQMIQVLQEEILSLITEDLPKKIKKKDYLNRILNDVEIIYTEDKEYDIESYFGNFIYKLDISNEDFIILYDYILWSKYECYSSIKYNYYKKNFKKLYSYLKKIKEENNLKSKYDNDEYNRA